MNSKWQTIQDRLLNFLRVNRGRAFKPRMLSRQLSVPNRDYQAFKRYVREWAGEGLIARFKGNQYGHPEKDTKITGELHVKTQGYGFLIRDDGGEDVFISQRNMGSAIHLDKVSVVLWAKPVGKLPEGKVLEVLERERKRLVGTFQQGRISHFVVPDDLKITRDISVAEEDRGGARPGQKVQVEIVRWGDSRRMPEGRVIRVLGRPDKPGVDVLSVIYGLDLPVDFPPDVEEEAGTVQDMISEAAMNNRLDLRDRCIFTIDPEDAKDFDDAVSLEKRPGGNWTLGVHIADVSTYVPVGSAMDREALRRGTSIYLVDRVIPMLPERISNHICSLKPEEDRMAFSVLMEITPDGKVTDFQMKESIIRSCRRLTYREAQDILDKSGKGEKKLGSVLMEMRQLSRILWETWIHKGMIDFDVPEPRVILDEKGAPCELKIRERLESHRIIEVFMLLANRTVAESIQGIRRSREEKCPFIYRVHERPRGRKLEEFVRFVRALGYDFPPGKTMTPKKFQRILDKARGTANEIIVEQIALRTMMKASYSTANAGHFGLGFSQYTHFTSPIRRYPDLMVHRLLKAYQRGDHKMPGMAMPLSKICDIANEREIIAQEAERESVWVKQLRYMENHLGECYDGVISGIAGFGVFVEIPEILVEGMIPVRELTDDYYEYDEKTYRLIGRSRGNIYRLGDPIRICVARILHDTKKLDFIPENQ